MLMIFFSFGNLERIKEFPNDDRHITFRKTFGKFANSHTCVVHDDASLLMHNASKFVSIQSYSNFCITKCFDELTYVSNIVFIMFFL